MSRFQMGVDVAFYRKSTINLPTSQLKRPAVFFKYLLLNAIKTGGRELVIFQFSSCTQTVYRFRNSHFYLGIV